MSRENLTTGASELNKTLCIEWYSKTFIDFFTERSPLFYETSFTQRHLCFYNVTSASTHSSTCVCHALKDSLTYLQLIFLILMGHMVICVLMISLSVQWVNLTFDLAFRSAIR